ncbi:voltage-dependent anion channel [Xylariaceae sp. FL0804]|nr:voltage-dependent anion channel [Xylariaceae sp. FL0804]
MATSLFATDAAAAAEAADKEEEGGEENGSSSADSPEPGAASWRRPPDRKDEVGWRRIVRNFTPSWFAVNMGTGIVSVLLHQLPYTAAGLLYVSYAFFGLNVLLFLVFAVLSLLRYTLWPEIWSAMLAHPQQSLFLGCFPMGLATIINMIVLSCRSWGIWTIYLAWGLWWLDVVLALASCLLVPFVVMHHHKPQLHETSATLLLPIVPAVVAAGTGGLVAGALAALPRVDHASATLVVSYLLLGLGEAFSLLVMALYFIRLHLHSIPPKEVIVSVFLPVGPLGQGGFAAQQLGAVALRVLPRTRAFPPLAGAGGDPYRGADVLYVLGVVAALVMWGFAAGWLVFAVISIAKTTPFPFNMGWWGFTFPIGVFATCTILLGKDLDSMAFNVLAMIFSASVFLLWLLVGIRTVHMAITGQIFHAPCLQDLRPKHAQVDANKAA